MTDNEKLAMWQGLASHTCDENAFHCDECARGSIQTPDYLNDDAAAMSLLGTLVEKGHEPKLQYYHNIKQWGMMPDEDCGYEWLDDTRREAVVSAVLEMIEKEDV